MNAGKGLEKDFWPDKATRAFVKTCHLCAIRAAH